jgi:thiaminase (transcriptional activator TenA)
MKKFCNEAWRHTVKLQQAVLDHPFNEELAEGTLSRERFQFYLAQDARYLVGFGRALAVAAARAPEPDDLTFFAGAAREAVVVERALHEAYFDQFGLSEADLAAIETSPTCLAYTSFLLATAQTGSYGELVAALLPCFWVYQHVGSDILGRTQVADNPYRAWIETYADDEFAASVETCRHAVDRAATAADPETRERMLAAFTRACEYEWMFWDSAYQLESWPTLPFRSTQG